MNLPGTGIISISFSRYDWFNTDVSGRLRYDPFVFLCHRLMDLSELLSTPLTWRDGQRWKREAELLAIWLKDNTSVAVSLRRQSEMVCSGVAEADPFIEQLTTVVCHECREVCCRWENCQYDATDLVHLVTLGNAVPVYSEGLPDQGPCRYLASWGCTIARTERPFRCTWHFCSALISHMAQKPQRAVRFFSIRFQEIQAIRQEMMALLYESIR
jgi:hypothetical protein